MISDHSWTNKWIITSEWMNEWMSTPDWKNTPKWMKGWLSEWINELLPLNGLINDYPW